MVYPPVGEDKAKCYNYRMITKKIPITVSLILALFLFLSGEAAAQDNVELNTILMQSTFMIEGQTAQGQRTVGTTFIMGRPYPKSDANPNELTKVRYVLITAAHVLEEMHGDSAILHLRHKVDADTWVPLPFQVPIRANGQPLWTKNPEADIAVMYLRIPNTATMSEAMTSTDLLADDKMLSKFEIHPGDELYCLGFPFGMSSNAAEFPILRSGRIASYPLLPTMTVKTFLFDFRVFKGNSGGPVYIAQSNRTYGGMAHLAEKIHFIVGLVSQESTYNEQLVGQYSAELHQYQLGLATVIDASIIRETIDTLPPPETLPD